MTRFDDIPDKILEEIIEEKKRRRGHGFYNLIYGLYSLTIAKYTDPDLFEFAWKVNDKLHTDQ
jgi:hypothetical protein